MKTNPTRKLTRLQFGKLLGYAWGKSANVENGMSAFRATGIAPFNPDVIPDYAYIAIEPEQGGETVSHASNSTAEKHSSPRPYSTQARATHSSLSSQSLPAPMTPSAQPGCSHWPAISTDEDDSIVEHDAINEGDATPGKLLNDISSIPKTSAAAVVRKRGMQIATILNSPERILMQKNKEIKKKKQTRPRIQKKKTVKKQRKSWNNLQTQEVKVQFYNSDVSDEEWNGNECVGCGEDYFKTSSTEEWIKCVRCSRWFHEGCSKYVDLCDLCGKFKNSRLK